MTQQTQEDENPHQKYMKLKLEYYRTPADSYAGDLALAALRKYRDSAEFRVFCKLTGVKPR